MSSGPYGPIFECTLNHEGLFAEGTVVRSTMKWCVFLLVVAVICDTWAEETTRSITIGAVLSAEQYGEEFVKAIEEANSREGK